MAGIIAIAAISSFAVLNRLLVRLQAESGASDDAKTLIDFLITDLQAVGGGAVRPWMALWVEDGGDPTARARCARFGQNPCGTSDRVTVALVVPDSRSCPITRMTDSEIFTDTNGPECCFVKLGENDGGGFVDRDSGLKMHVVAVRNGASRQVSLSGLTNPGTGTTPCSMRWAPGPMAGIDNKDGDTLLDAVDTDAAGVLPSVFDGGTVTAVAIRTLFLDERSHDLFAFEDKRDFNGVAVTVDDDERRRIASNVYDLQLQLGYDGDPADGRLVDRGTVDDEWLYNALGDGLPRPVGVNDLRMSAVGVVVGVNVKDPGYASSAQVIGGTVKSQPGTHMRSGMGKAALRNAFVFF